MPRTRVTLPRPVPGRYRGELERRLFFVSADVSGYQLVETGDMVTAVDLSTSGEVAAEELMRKIHYLVENEVLSQRPVPAKRVWGSSLTELRPTNVFPELVVAGLAAELGEGQVAFTEPLIALMDALDAQVAAFAKSTFGAQEFRYPTLLPSSVLERCGYFNSFPQLVMFVTRLHTDVDVYRAFVADYLRQGRIDPSVLASCSNVDYCLPPTMCFHTYGQFAGRRLEPDQMCTVTSKGKSFRFESRYFSGLERLWDFTIREIVFIGPREAVLDARQRFMRHSFALVEQLGLAGYCEVGHDPFFCNTEAAGRIGSQRLLELKYELQLEVGDGRTIAAASFNFHDNFFGERFGIRQADQGWVNTACVGFGLERLMYAFLCHHGFDERQWPWEALAPVAGRIEDKDGIE